jgi:hypothetical protein
MTDFVVLATSRAEERKGERRGDPGLFIASSNLRRGLGFSTRGEIGRWRVQTCSGRTPTRGRGRLSRVGPSVSKKRSRPT